MTEPTDPPGPVDPTPTYPAAPPPAPLPPPVGAWQSASEPAQTLQPVRAGGNRSKVLAVGAAVLVLGGGAYASTQLLSDERGAGSPEEATQELIDAINDEDVLGVIDLLPEGERELLIDITDELSSEGQRLGLLSDSFRLDGFPGVDVEITDPELDVDELGDGLAVVSVVDGDAAIEVDGDEVTGAVGDVAEALAEANDIPLEADDVDEEQDLGELADDAPRIAVIEEGGRWFPSIGFTVAETWRFENNRFGDEELDAPGLDDGIDARGADDPVSVVQALLDAATSADVEEAISLLDPGEMGALQVYAPLFVGDVEAEDTGVTIDVEDAEVTSLGGGVSRVVPTELTAEGDFDEGQFTFELADGCFHVTTEADDPDAEDLDIEACQGTDPDEFLADLGDQFDDLEVPDELVELTEAFQPIQVGVITVERDGATFISPIRTLFDVLGAGYRGLERSDLEEGGIVFRALTGDLDDEFDEFFDELGERFDEQFGSSFDPIGDEVVDVPFEDDFEDGFPAPGDEVREPTGATGPNGALVVGDVVEGHVDADGSATFTLEGSDGSFFIGAQALDQSDLTITLTDATTGEELASSDDFNGTDPEVFVDLADGQTIVVTVEEFFGDAADFVVYFEE